MTREKDVDEGCISHLSSQDNFPPTKIYTLGSNDKTEKTAKNLKKMTVY
jgi:hypothetical protein